jgi:hypothetical protein
MLTRGFGAFSYVDDHSLMEGSTMTLARLAVDETPHNMDGLLLHGWDGSERVEAFISRRVMDSWVDPRDPYRKGRSLSTLLRSSVLLSPSISAERRLTANILLWIFYCLTSRKAKRRSIQANWYANRCLPLSNGYRVRWPTCPPYCTITSAFAPGLLRAMHSSKI